MICGSWTDRQATAKGRGSSRTLLALVSAALMVGCGESSAPLADIYANYEPAGSWGEPVVTEVMAQNTECVPLPVVESETLDHPPEPRVAAMMPMADYMPADDVSEQAVEDTSEKYWSFVAEEESGPTLHLPALIRLPEVEEEAVVPHAPPIALLLPPQEIVEEVVTVEKSEPAADIAKLPENIDEVAVAPVLEAPFVETPLEALAIDSPVTQEETLPVLAELTEQDRLLQALVRDSSSATTGVLTDARVNELAKSKIQSAYAMANRGAMYLARQELIEVLRLISQAKDAQQGTPGRSVALATGLRALRESEDFAPRGTELEAELETAVLCASHRTPIAKQPGSENVLPRLMMDRYLRYAQLQLSMSVAGEPAGSMALHALGKLHSQLGRVEPTKHRLAERHAIAFQQAALLAHNQNYLAAHELAVLLATTGHYAEAERLLIQVATRAPNAVVHRNLARVQEKLGRTAEASTNRDHARQLAQQGASGTNNVQWVSPEAFANVNAQTPQYRTAQAPVPAQQTNGVPIPGQRRPLNTSQWR